VLAGPQPKIEADRSTLIAKVHDALYASKIVSYAQGLDLMRTMSDKRGWALDLGAIASIWRGGCIIRARFLNRITEAFGRDPALPRRDEPFTDMTILAGGGPVWSCGYDDHEVPPVRGGGNQGWHTGCLWAVMGALTAVLQRDVSGRGQHVDVSLHAAANVTTEAGSYEWLVARDTVQRQTGRHAAVVPTRYTRMVAADGRDVTTGFPPRNPKEMQVVVDWLDELGLRDEFPDVVLLEIGIERGGVQLSEVGQDDLATEISGSGRDALLLIASKVTAQEFFIGAQERGLPCSVINAPEEAFEDAHFRARGFAVEVDHPDLGRSFTYPGAPYKLPASPWRISRRAPRLGEHTDAVLGDLPGQ
jgi:crotonobetainyl-CoA:carnitine CoA-transferase CaiB-like acyl-CoA transferase